MGANKQVKQAKKQVRELELLVAGAAAGAEQRLAALDDMLERSTASTEQTLAAIRGAVDEAERRVEHSTRCSNGRSKTPSVRSPW